MSEAHSNSSDGQNPSKNDIQQDSIVSNPNSNGEQPREEFDINSQISPTDTIPLQDEIVQLDKPDNMVRNDVHDNNNVQRRDVTTSNQSNTGAMFAGTSVGFSVDNAVVRDIAPFATLVVIVIVVVFMVLFRDQINNAIIRLIDKFFS